MPQRTEFASFAKLKCMEMSFFEGKPQKFRNTKAFVNQDYS